MELSKFVDALMLTRSSLKLLCIDFSQIYNTVMVFGYCKFCFCSISWEQFDAIRPSFAYALMSTRSKLELLHITFIPSTNFHIRLCVHPLHFGF